MYCDDPIETFEENGLTIEIWADEDATSPRHDDNVGILALFHRKWNLPQEQEGLSTDMFSSWDEMEEYILEELDAIVLRPVYMYDHSMQDFSTSVRPGWYHYSWDGGQVGFIFTTRKRMNEIGIKDTKEADEAMVKEVEDFAAYWQGNACFYDIMDKDGELLDRAGGYLDFNQCVADAKAAAQKLAEPA